MMIIFHFDFLLNLIFERKKVADKNYHRPKGTKNPHELKHAYSVSTSYGFNIRIMKFNSVVLKNLYHKIDLSPNLVF